MLDVIDANHFLHSGSIIPINSDSRLIEIDLSQLIARNETSSTNHGRLIRNRNNIIVFFTYQPLSYLRGMKAVFNITLPTSWDELNNKQLHLVYSLFASDFSTEEIKTICILKWNGLKILSALPYGRFIIKSGRRKVILTSSQIHQATSTLDFLDTIPQMPVRISRIGKNRAVLACFEQLPFEQFILIENLFQGYLNIQDNNLLQQIAKVLYRSEKVKANKVHLIGIFYWMAAIKQYFAREFPNFYQPASNDSSNLLGTPQTSTYQQLRDTTNAMIRALTGGDITKEESILKTDTWRALTELDALAKEAANLRKLSKK